MGIDTGCMLIVGLPADELVAGLPAELQQKVNRAGLWEVVSEGGDLGLHRASPYFDAGVDECVWGVSLAAEYWRAIEIDAGTLPQKIAEAQATFKAKTGLDGKLYVSAHVT